MTTHDATLARTNVVANVLYVAPNGDDQNDGLSWGTAKRTILAAYDALPTGFWNVEQNRISSPPATGDQPAQGGTIYIATGSAVGGEVRGQGIWILGPGSGDPGAADFVLRQLFREVGLLTDSDPRYRRAHPPSGSIKIPRPGQPEYVDAHAKFQGFMLDGWRWQKNVRFIGVGTGVLQHGEVHAARITTSITTTTPDEVAMWRTYSRMPAIWLAGATIGLSFENLLIADESAGIRVGLLPVGALRGDKAHAGVCEGIGRLRDPRDQCSDIDRRRSRVAMTTNGFFRNVQVSLRRGPVVDVGWGYRLWFERSVFTHGTPHFGEPDLVDAGIPLEDDRRAAMLFKSAPLGDEYRFAGGANSYLVTVTDCRFGGGGNLKSYAPEGIGLTLRGLTVEGNGGAVSYPCPVHIIGQNPAGYAYLQDVGLADGAAEATVKIESVAGKWSSENVVCVNVAKVIGPATVINRDVQTLSTEVTTPLTQGQSGFWLGHVVGRHDALRRSFAPMAVRFPNLAPQDVARWSAASGDARVTRLVSPGDAQPAPDRLAPDGTRQAFELAPSGTADGFYRRTFALNVGGFSPSGEVINVLQDSDHLIAGVWVRRPKQMRGLGGEARYVVGKLAANPVYLPDRRWLYDFGNDQTYLRLHTPIPGDGEWRWVSLIGRVRRNGRLPRPVAGEGVFHFELYAWRHGGVDYPLYYYAPMALRLPSTISTNEAHEVALHAATYPSEVPAGTVTLLGGQSLLVHADLELRGDLRRSGPSPEYQFGVAVGAARDRLVAGNEQTGSMWVTTGPDTGAAGEVFSLRFRSPAPVTRHLLLTPATAAAGANLPGFYGEVRRDRFVIAAAAALAPSVRYGWHYQVIASSPIA